jgi:hypothetical protein
MACFCSKEFDIDYDCENDGPIPSQYGRSYLAGLTQESIPEAVRVLLESGQILKIELSKVEGWENWDLHFETCPGVCANRLGYYLHFQEG